MTGEFIGIGVGPGDPELLTVKAVKTLQRCDLLALPVKDKEQCYAYQIAVQAVPQICDKPCICLDFPMSKDVSVLDAKMKENAEEIISWLNKDMRIAFLTIGDPTVYATYHYCLLYTSFLRKEKQKSEAAAIQALKKYMQVPCFGQDRQQH